MVFRIPRRSLFCHKKREPLSAGTTYFSRLHIDKNEEWQRADFCAACWESEPKENISFWRGKVAASGMDTEEKRLFLEELVRKAVVRLEDPACSPEEKYLLAFFLKREKRLHLEKEEGETLYFIDRSTKSPILIEKREAALKDASLKKTLQNLFFHERTSF
jgi:hypothetical protein